MFGRTPKTKFEIKANRSIPCSECECRIQPRAPTEAGPEFFMCPFLMLQNSARRAAWRVCFKAIYDLCLHILVYYYIYSPINDSTNQKPNSFTGSQNLFSKSTTVSFSTFIPSFSSSSCIRVGVS